MKYILVILFSLICYCSLGQFVNTTTSGSPTTLLRSKGGYVADSMLAIPAFTFADTTAANWSVVRFYSGAIIQTSGPEYWIRQLNPSKWNKFNTSAASLVSISQAYGITNTPNPITTTGIIKVDTSLIIPYTDTLKSNGIATKNFLLSGYVPYVGATQDVYSNFGSNWSYVWATLSGVGNVGSFETLDTLGVGVNIEAGTAATDKYSLHIASRDLTNIADFWKDRIYFYQPVNIIGSTNASTISTTGLDVYTTNLGSTFTIRTKVDKGYVDSAITASPSGTVTSIATNNGTGISGGTITTTGTLVLDTTNLSTRLWRQKAVDSLNGLINLKIPYTDTVNTIATHTYVLGQISTSSADSNFFRRTVLPNGPTVTLKGSMKNISLTGYLNLSPESLPNGEPVFRANNGALTSTIMDLQDNGSTVVSVIDGGNVVLRQVPTGNYLDSVLVIKSGVISRVPRDSVVSSLQQVTMKGNHTNFNLETWIDGTGGGAAAYSVNTAAGVRRFAWGTQNVESGGNTGSNPTLFIYDDAGNFLRTGFAQNRSDGQTTFPATVVGVTETLSDNSTKLASTAFVKGQGYLTSSTGVSSITGTANQVIASASTGAVTLSTPQSIGTSSTVQFGAMTITGNTRLATSGGNVSIGTTADGSVPLYIRHATPRLDLDDNTQRWGFSFSGTSLAIRDATNGINQMLIAMSTGAITATNLAGTGSRAVLADASGVLSAPVSDSSLKKNFGKIDSALIKLMKLHPLTYEFNDGYKNYGTGRIYGHTAQDVERVFPELVFTTPKTLKKGINYGTGQFESILVKAIQDLKNEKDAEIADLKNKLSILEQKVNQLLAK